MISAFLAVRLPFRRFGRALRGTRHGERSSAAVVCAMLLCMLSAGPSSAVAQESDDTALATVGGALLGAYSGSVLGLVGSLLPCDRTVLGAGCPTVVATAGAVVGLVSGGFIGAADTEEVRDRGRGAAYGALIGLAVGSVLQRSVRQYAWNDALLVAGVGAAVGAAPMGALIGTGIGAAAGSLAWAFSPRGGIQDLVMFTLMGATLGGLVDWVQGGVDAHGSGPALATSFTFTVG